MHILQMMQGLDYLSAQTYADQNPDVPELLETLAEDQRRYFEYERNSMAGASTSSSRRFDLEPGDGAW